ncbi:MAG: sigma-70 family RNA polymerase sigma factor [Gammaproteobacteria bacterium]|nr:sigma-70 family RNA polymerase sigma factor [Gammaproteobacteria bacterium]
MYEEEQELISRLIRKEDAAFRQAIKQYQSSMLYLAHSFVGNKFADEVVQEAWFSAIRALPKFESRSSLRTWLLRIVANEAKTRLRKENRLTSLEAMTAENKSLSDRYVSDGNWGDKIPIQWDCDSPEELLSVQELKRCMDQLIENLPELQGATLNLREEQGYSLDDICNILEVSESNVRVLLHRARNRLFLCIEHFQATGECCTD